MTLLTDDEQHIVDSLVHQYKQSTGFSNSDFKLSITVGVNDGVEELLVEVLPNGQKSWILLPEG